MWNINIKMSSIILCYFKGWTPAIHLAILSLVYFSMGNDVWTRNKKLREHEPTGWRWRISIKESSGVAIWKTKDKVYISVHAFLQFQKNVILYLAFTVFLSVPEWWNIVFQALRRRSNASRIYLRFGGVVTRLKAHMYHMTSVKSYD